MVGVPHIVPHSDTRWEVNPEMGGMGGMPLAVMQEDFLVDNIFSVMN